MFDNGQNVQLTANETNFQDIRREKLRSVHPKISDVVGKFALYFTATNFTLNQKFEGTAMWAELKKLMNFIDIEFNFSVDMISRRQFFGRLFFVLAIWNGNIL